MKKTNIIIAVIVGLVVIGYAASRTDTDDKIVTDVGAVTGSEANEPAQTDAIPAIANVEAAQTEAPVTAAVQTKAPETEAPDGRMQGEGALDDVYIKILSARKTVDYEDKPAIIVSYEFTNNSSDAANFMFSVKHTVFQSGIECSSGISSFGDDTYSSDNQLKDIKQGATLTVDCFYKLNDEATDIEVEVGKIFDFADPPTLVVKTFTLQ